MMLFEISIKSWIYLLSQNNKPSFPIGASRRSVLQISTIILCPSDLIPEFLKPLAIAIFTILSAASIVVVDIWIIGDCASNHNNPLFAFFVEEKNSSKLMTLCHLPKNLACLLSPIEGISNKTILPEQLLDVK